MRLVIGNNKKELSESEFKKITKGFKRVEIDLGTGDGRFVFKNALVSPETLFIGVDPSEKQLEIYSKKVLRKKLKNALFVVGSVEHLPPELLSSTNRLYITLPWGTLLESIVKPTQSKVFELAGMLKKDGKIEMILGYSPEFEPSETKRLNLPEIDDGLMNNSIVPIFKNCGLELKKLECVTKEQLKDIETTWAKKLKFGKDRKIYKVVFQKVL
jgi:16S rRNA (adenine(1408)-N(1))-methyltransferase